MKGIIESFALSFFSSLAFEKYQKFMLTPEFEDTLSIQEKIVLNEEIVEKAFTPRLFYLNDLIDILSITLSPFANILIDTIPSGYFSVTAVLESQITNEWYIVQSGEFALQGSGGGYKKFERLLNILKKHKVPIALWCSKKGDLNQLEHGEITWLQLKPKIYPFLSVVTPNQKGWKEVVDGVRKFFPELNSLLDRSIYHLNDKEDNSPISNDLSTCYYFQNNTPPQGFS